MFQKIDPKEILKNPFTMIGDQWLLVTAGNASACNTMTASWGGVGVMWGNPVATCYIRPQRYTKAFLDQEEYFTLSVLPEQYRKALAACGATSGREHDKFAENGLSVAYAQCGAPYVEQAELVLVCKKQYAQEMSPQCLTEGDAIDQRWYPNHDWHTMYIGQIVEAYQK
jgi:flavin reductase (DIM6/NTAB) family NADH-FMN oxidoreductase RutF